MTTAIHPQSAVITASMTVGIEEEFVLTDRARQPVAAAADVLRRTPAHGDLLTEGELQGELARCQVELATPVCIDGEDVLAQVTRLRSSLAAAAAGRGLLALATGTPPLSGPGTELSCGERYQRMARHYRALTAAAHVCGCHVHIAVPGRDAGIQVSNYLRPWLPVLLAASANSPFTAGTDTGYASWRHESMMQWPASGPPPYFESADHHDSVLAALTRSGGILDPAAVYWAVRLSPRYPTVEVRICDVTRTGAEAALLATLIRALAAMAMSGRTPGQVPDEVLRADLWRAARDGLAGRCAAPAGSDPVPAAQALLHLLEHVRPALRDLGEEDFAQSLARDLLQSGDGASRQRSAHRKRGRLCDVAAELALSAATAGLVSSSRGR